MRLTLVFFCVAAVLFVLTVFTPQSTEAGHKKKLLKAAGLALLLKPKKKFIFLPIPLPMPLGLSLHKPAPVWHADPWPSDPWW
jgi:hypothetical protein